MKDGLPLIMQLKKDLRKLHNFCNLIFQIRIQSFDVRNCFIELYCIRLIATPLYSKIEPQEKGKVLFGGIFLHKHPLFSQKIHFLAKKSTFWGIFLLTPTQKPIL